MRPVTKVCSRCKKRKRVEYYYRQIGAPHNLSCQCVTCKKESQQAVYRRYPGYKRECDRRSVLWKFGLTVEQFNQMKREQCGRCYICNKKESPYKDGRRKELSIDHNHTTGQVRKLLCHKCNTAIGMLNEDIPRIQRVLSYLQEF